jgi:hypothetical protein
VHFHRPCTGPQLGKGPRWDLRKAVTKKMGAFIREDSVDDDEMYVDETEEEENASAGIQKSDYIKKLERENRSLKEGSDARCVKMLGYALSGSINDTDVVFLCGDGEGRVCGHRRMLCAASETFAGMFRCGMVEEQEGKIRMPPGIGTAALRGLLEWVYLGEISSLPPFFGPFCAARECSCYSY